MRQVRSYGRFGRAAINSFPMLLQFIHLFLNGIHSEPVKSRLMEMRCYFCPIVSALVSKLRVWERTSFGETPFRG